HRRVSIEEYFMHFLTIVRSLFGRDGQPRRKSVRFRPEVTALEGRWLPSTVTEFPLPPNDFMGISYGATAITSGPDGNLWFTDPTIVGRGGRITPAGQVTEFTAPSPGVGNTITAGADGNVWFAAGSFNLGITRITPAGQFTAFDQADILGSIN